MAGHGIPQLWVSSMAMETHNSHKFLIQPELQPWSQTTVQFNPTFDDGK